MVKAIATVTEIGRLIPKDTAVSYLTDSLTGILSERKNDYKQLLEDELRAKYEITD